MNVLMNLYECKEGPYPKGKRLRLFLLINCITNERDTTPYVLSQIHAVGIGTAPNGTNCLRTDQQNTKVHMHEKSQAS